MNQDEKNNKVSRREALGTMVKAIAGGTIVLSGVGGITYLRFLI